MTRASELTEPRFLDKSAERIRRMFGQIAGRYDLLNHVLSLGIDRSWRRRTVCTVPPAGRLPVLDLCTGTGDLALAYWRAGGGGVRVVGADFCRPMLQRARAKAARRRAAGVSFVEADALALPFVDESFQIASCAFGLRNTSDPDRALREMYRVLCPGGRLAVLEFSLPRHHLLSAIYRFYFARVLPRLGQLLACNQEDAYSYLPASVQEFPAGEALLERLRAAGFVEPRYHAFTCGIACLYVAVR
ncbi:MAG: bifunctional demethylmenaquinone methyltransferase/2-methoxy-6-polyprenyl-1,4-benzoquinol methylase UbiE [Pirellulales bacterium]|nr:bifunctional demethylmenaquinone methyltransferase/2-methoxy-6-polyprenyl-1,4-benzoquinol methylase UbiE [Pirellulales bacterium]